MCSLTIASDGTLGVPGHVDFGHIVGNVAYYSSQTLSRSWVTLPGKVNFYLFYSSDLFPYCDFSSMVEPAWAHVANVKGIQAMAITGGRVPCLGVMKQNRGDQSTEPF